MSSCASEIAKYWIALGKKNQKRKKNPWKKFKTFRMNWNKVSKCLQVLWIAFDWNWSVEFRLRFISEKNERVFFASSIQPYHYGRYFWNLLPSICLTFWQSIKCFELFHGVFMSICIVMTMILGWARKNCSIIGPFLYFKIEWQKIMHNRIVHRY